MIDSDDYFKRIQDNRSMIAQVYFQAINRANVELYGRMKDHLVELKDIYPLIDFVLTRLVLVTELTNRNDIWDAEIIHRTALETLLKLLFITSADKEEREKRIDEYWNQLPEIASMALSAQAKKNLIHSGHLELHRLAYTPLILSNDEEERLRGKWNKKDRKALEQKWSFTEMVSVLADNYRGKRVGEFVMLLHGYRMSSHVAHGDEVGLYMIYERKNRPAKEEAIADFAHFIRIMSDCFSHCVLIGMETMNYLSQDSKYFSDLYDSLADTRKVTELYQMELYDDPIYDPFRSRSTD